MLRIKRKFDLSTEDSYIKNYNKKAKGNNSAKKAYKLAGRKIKLGGFAAGSRTCEEKEKT